MKLRIDSFECDKSSGVGSTVRMISVALYRRFGWLATFPLPGQSGRLSSKPPCRRLHLVVEKFRFLANRPANLMATPVIWIFRYEWQHQYHQCDTITA